jgi:glycosyltransferase involved in cell wall biosynthesis
MRILDFLTHMGFQHTLCRTGHDFDLAPSELCPRWNSAQRPRPPNAREAAEPLRPDAYDVAIASTIPQFRRIAAADVPKIFLNHMHRYPWADAFLEALPPEVERVYVSDHKRSTYGRLGEPGRTIRLAVDTQTEYRGFTGELPRILNVTPVYPRREAFRGYALFRELTRDLPCQLVGAGNEAFPGAFAARDHEHLKALYRSHRCYLSTDRGGYLHLSTLEAMGTGMPLVALPIAELEPYVEPGVDAFIAEDPADLRRALERLLADPDLAREVGRRGREVVRRHFGVQAFLDAWDALFREMAARRR